MKPFNKKAVNQHINSLWRYADALPCTLEQAITLGEGFTPMLPIDFNGKKVWIKQDYLFPTGSYKDRGAAVLISVAKQQGITHVVQDSSGNAGCAIAAYAAKANIACNIFVPKNTSPAKLAQIRMYGAQLTLVDGNRNDTAIAALKAAETTYYASHCYNPLFYEGTKTFAYEVCEQLDWQAPDVVVVPAGNGTLVIGCYIGFMHLLQSGVINHIPKIIAIQAANCAPLYHAFSKKNNTVFTDTIAEGIAIEKPVQAELMLEIIQQTKGTFLTVTEEEIIAALKHCCTMGHYIEPTSAATIAGVSKALLTLGDEGLWVSLFTGHGLKSTDKILTLLDKK